MYEEAEKIECANATETQLPEKLGDVAFSYSLYLCLQRLQSGMATNYNWSD